MYTSIILRQNGMFVAYKKFQHHMAAKAVLYYMGLGFEVEVTGTVIPYKRHLYS